MICRKCGTEDFEYLTIDNKPTGLCHACVSKIVVDYLKKKEVEEK